MHPPYRAMCIRYGPAGVRRYPKDPLVKVRDFKVKTIRFNLNFKV